MRRFYTFYKDDIKLPPLVAEISWPKKLVIMEKCKDMLKHCNLGYRFLLKGNQLQKI